MFTIANNFLGDNAAGIYVETYSNVISNALYSNISNNVIIYTTHGEPLHVEGHYFQVNGFHFMFPRLSLSLTERLNEAN